jgi:hypothetical protein
MFAVRVWVLWIDLLWHPPKSPTLAGAYFDRFKGGLLTPPFEGGPGEMLIVKLTTILVSAVSRLPSAFSRLTF